jgi:4-diphosphocytidyl-2-C-methyl-D-erythritol kinase
VLEVRAFAKINMGLWAGKRRPDGYHPLVTLYQSVSLADRLQFRRIHAGTHSLHCDDAALAGESNLVMKAMRLLDPHLGPSRRVEARLWKRIPTGAGLGGGSSDAAAALLAVNRLWNLRLSAPELERCAARLGSDVPFFLRGGTALGAGRGEIVCPLAVPPLPPACALAWPAGGGLSTAEVYAAFDRMGGGRLTEKKKLRIIFTGVLDMMHGSAPAMPNTLEEAALRLRPELRRLRAAFRRLGLRPSMTGSGATFYAFCPSARRAREAARDLRRAGGGEWEAAAARPVGPAALQRQLWNTPRERGRQPWKSPKSASFRSITTTS